MSDEEFLKLKQSIRGFMIETQEINHSFSNILQVMSDLDEDISKLQFNLLSLQNRVYEYELKNKKTN